MPTIVKLRDRAWKLVALNWKRHAELSKVLLDTAREAGDVEGEVHGLFHRAVACLRFESCEAATAATVAARDRSEQLGIQSAAWLAQVQFAHIAEWTRRYEEALRIGLQQERAAKDVRLAPHERWWNQTVVGRANLRLNRTDEALRFYHAALASADSAQDLALRARTLNSLANVHADVFNVDDARVLYEESLAIRRSLDMPWTVAALVIANLVFAYENMDLHERALELTDEIFAEAARAGADAHTWRRNLGQPPFALCLLRAGRDDEAQRILEMRPSVGEHLVFPPVDWCWVEALWLHRQGRFAEARDRCRAFIAGLDARGELAARQALVHLHDVVSDCCAALGDHTGALAATREAQALAVPLVRSSLNARLFAHDIEQGMQDDRARKQLRRCRLQAVDREVRELGAALADDSASSRAPDAGPGRRFLAHVSHEMRAPLNGMLGMTSLLLVSQLDERQRRFVSATESSAQTLLDLVNDILEVAKIESGRYALDPQPFALRPMLDETLALYAPRARLQGVALVHSVDAAVPATLVADAPRLTQVLGKLVDHALKVSAGGEVALVVRSAGDRFVRFEVRDMSESLSELAQAQLFCEQVEERGGDDDRPSDAGLGLALCAHLVRLMGGEIGVHGRPDHGNCVWLELPIVARHLAASTSALPLPAVPAGLSVQG